MKIERRLPWIAGCCGALLLSGLALSSAVAEPPAGLSQPEVRVREAPASHQTESVDDLVRQLGSESATDRAMAACHLGRMDARAVSRARDRLLALLVDGTEVEGPLCRERGERWRQRWEEPTSPGREAALALEELGSDVLDPLLRILRGPDGDGREHAALALGLVESFRAVDPLVRTMSDDDVARVRARAAWALGLIEASAPVEALIRVLREDSSTEVREQAAWALGMIESGTAVVGLADAIRDGDAGVREQAAWALGMIESATGTEALLPALEDDVAGVREQAAWALGMIESSDAVEGLVRALREDDSADVREQAAWALGMIESSDAVEGLVRALREYDSADVREQAAWALGMIEDVAALPALLDAVEDEDPEVREQVMWALSMVVDSSGMDGIDRGELADALRRALEREP